MKKILKEKQFKSIRLLNPKKVDSDRIKGEVMISIKVTYILRYNCQESQELFSRK